MAELIDGSSEWPFMHSVPGCKSSAGQTTTVYQFEKRSCSKLKGADVATRLRKQSQNEMTEGLSVGLWIVCKSYGNKDQPFWLRRTVSNVDWNNNCKWLSNRISTKT